MSKLTQFLQRARLIEDDSPPPEMALPDPPVQPDPPTPEFAIRSPARQAGDDANGDDASNHVLPEGVSIELIFQEANVPETPFPIERLAKLIDGLKQLDPVTQKAAILAMDSADDSWTIEGVLKDAQLKTDALRAYADRMNAKATQIQGNIDREIASMTSEKDSSLTDIQAQIADLQRKLEATVAQHATDASGLAAQKQAAQQAAERERQRVTEYSSRINNLIHPFLSNR